MTCGDRDRGGGEGSQERRGEEEGCGRDSRSENGHGETEKRDGRAKLA